MAGLPACRCDRGEEGALIVSFGKMPSLYDSKMRGPCPAESLNMIGIAPLLFSVQLLVLALSIGC